MQPDTNRPARFSAALPFDRLSPFDPLFFERVPLLLACQIAVANFIANRKRDRHDSSRATELAERSVNNRFWAAECGVFTGNAMIATAKLMRDANVDFMLLGLDTFTGLPELTGKDLDLAPENAIYRTRKLFTETSIEAVSEIAVSEGLAESIWLVKGEFKDTLPTLPDGARYNFVNIDCDLYEPHLQCLEYFYPRVEPGGVIFFDDYESVNFPMVRRAVDDFMCDKPESLAFLRFGADCPNHCKAFLVKY